MNVYKVLDTKGEAYHGGTAKWHLPIRRNGTWIPGEWMPPIDGELVACKNGYHLCRKQDLVSWLGPTIYEAEYDGEVLEGNDKIVVRKARLLRKVRWNERIARTFAADCAEHVIGYYAKEFPTDDRPQQAIRVVRLYLDGKATREELANATSDATSDATNAANAAAYAANAAANAVIAAAYAANAAANAVAYAATAAYAAADAANAANAAAYAVIAVASERIWQTERLFYYMEAEEEASELKEQM